MKSAPQSLTEVADVNTGDTPRTEHHTGAELARADAFRDAPADARELIEQHKWLEELRAHNEEVTVLTQRKCEQEVECIAADAALNSISTKQALDLDPTQGADLADTLHVKREIETELRALNLRVGEQAGTPTNELEQLKAGQDALKSWLNVPQAEGPQHVFKVVYIGVMIATLFVIWAAVVIHPILFLLLLGLGAVLAFLRSSEQNSTWIRLGAKRRFEDTGLGLSASWEEAKVRDRLAGLEAKIEAFTHRDVTLTEPTDDEPGRIERLVEDLEQTTGYIDNILAKVGLNVDSLDVESEQGLELLATARRERQNLNHLNAKLKSVTAARETAQEALFMFLARQGEAPPGGTADIDALSAGLDRVASRVIGKPRRTSGGINQQNA
jgi:hypothetical protein